jgi:hypothetical protein
MILVESITVVNATLNSGSFSSENGETTSAPTTGIQHAIGLGRRRQAAEFFAKIPGIFCKMRKISLNSGAMFRFNRAACAKFSVQS